MAVKRKYRLNLMNYGNLPAIMLSQYDEGYALEFEIRDGTEAASDLSAYTVTLKGTRADTLAYSFAGTISTNVLTFVIDTTMTACAGRGTAEIAIKDTANDVLFATFNMPVFVERAAVPEGSIDADVERAQEIAEQIQEIVNTAAAEVKGEAESWAVGQRDGTDVPATDPTYHNNAKYYSEQAQQAADSIGIDATLTQAGKAADAKKTGDEITELKSELSDVDIAMRKVPSMASGDGDADLYVSDDSGNALAKFLDGGFQVKKFKGFDFITFHSESKVYTGAELSFVITRHFSKGDRIVLHMERGATPWEYGAYVTYTAGQTVVVDNWRGDCAWLEYTLTEDVDKITAVYPANSNFVPRSTNITFEVSLLGDVPIRPTVVTVKQDGTGDFTTLRGALDSIGTKANDVLNPYRIEIYPGTYDVLADYTDEEIGSAAYTQTDFVGPKLLNGMYLIGMGAFPEETVLTASLDPDKWNNTIRGAISTLNCQGTGGFENLTVEAHNIRYCVHDDYHTPLKKKIKRTVKNCIFRGYGISYTPGHTYGASTTSSGCDFEFINCDFGEVALIHTLPTMQFRPHIHFINCTGSGFMIGDYETVSVDATGRYVCRLDGCGFPWVKNSLDTDNAVSHALICGSGSRSPLYQLPTGTPYLTDDVTVVPNVLLQFTGGVGTVVERYSDTGHGPRFRLATSAKTADGVVVYQDDDNTYIQTRGYVKTDRTNLTQFVLGDYVGLSDGSMVVVSDPADAFAQIRYIDASGYGYLMLKGV